MTKLNDFRLVNDFEKSILVNTLREISHKSDILLQKIQDSLYISFDRTSSKGQQPSIYLVPTNHANIIRKFETDIQISSVGLYFGFIKKESFRLSLEGAEFLVNREYLSKDQILVIDSNGEKSVLYGNDIKKGNVINFPANLRKGDFLVINNVQNEICAITQSLISKQDLTRVNSGDRIALNLVDKGYYLRKRQ